MMIIMRYPEGRKAEVRQRIVAAAAAALRDAGIDGVSIPKLMAKVGLTHGGFYAHFRDRDALVAEAVQAAAHETRDQVFASAKGVEALLATYVSGEHVSYPGQGCVVAALGAEARRQSPVVRRAFGYAARGLIGLVDEALGRKRGAAPSDRALMLTAAMVGAVVLARCIDDPELAGRMLQATKRLALQDTQ